MMSALDKMVAKLLPLVGGIVRKCTLLVWPDEDGYETSDIRVNFKLNFADGLIRDVTFGTDTDGQTPLIIDELISSHYNLADLSKRERLWKEEKFWYTEKGISYESFDLCNSPDYDLIVGYGIDRIAILHFDDEEKTPTGLRIRFDSGKELYSLPGIAGNKILTQLPQDWYFPAPIKRMEVMKNAR